MTYNEMVRTIDPSITDDQADLILWEFTAFPFVRLKAVYYQARRAFRCGRSGRDPNVGFPRWKKWVRR